MLGAGTVINPLIRVITAVIILGAVGIFIVKPALDTTERAIDSVNASVQDGLEQGQQASDNAQLNAAESRAESYAQSLLGTWPAAAREINRCVRAAGDNATAMNGCAELGQTLVHTVQSDRNFALSYADGLDAQGDGAGAERVRDCVKDAGFRPAAMQRCRDLADDLLFG
jgi:hypothetical protein